MGTPEDVGVGVAQRPGLQVADPEQGVPFTNYRSPDDGLVQEVSWSPDGSRLALLTFSVDAHGGVTSEGMVSVTRFGTWQDEGTVPCAPTLLTHSIAWHADGDRLACMDQGRVVIWHVVAREVVATIPVDGRLPIDLAWSQHGILALACMVGEQCQVELIEEFQGSFYRREELTLTPPIPGSAVASIGWSPNGSRLAAVLVRGEENHLAIWESPTTGSGAVVVAHLGDGLVERAELDHAWDPEGSRVTVAVERALGEDGETDTRPRIVVWNGRGDPVIKRLLVPDLDLFSATWSPDGDFISCSTADELMVLDARSMNVRLKLPAFYSAQPPVVRADGEEIAFVSSLGFNVCHAWSPDSTQVAAGNVGGLRIFDLSGVVR